MRKLIAWILLAALLSPIAGVLCPGKAQAAFTGPADWERLEGYRSGMQAAIQKQAPSLTLALILTTIQEVGSGDDFADPCPGLDGIISLNEYYDSFQQVYDLYTAFKENGVEGAAEGVANKVLDDLLGNLAGAAGPLGGAGLSLTQSVITGLFELGYSTYEAQGYKTYMQDRLVKGYSSQEAFNDLFGVACGGAELCRSYVREHQKDIGGYMQDNNIPAINGLIVYPEFAREGKQYELKQHVEYLVRAELEKDCQYLRSALAENVSAQAARALQGLGKRLAQWNEIKSRAVKRSRSEEEAMQKAQQEFLASLQAYNQAWGISNNWVNQEPYEIPDIETVDVSPALPTFDFAAKRERLKVGIDRALAVYQKRAADEQVPAWFHSTELSDTIRSYLDMAVQERDNTYAKIGRFVTMKKHFIPALVWSPGYGNWVELPAYQETFNYSDISLEPGESWSGCCQEGSICLRGPAVLYCGEKGVGYTVTLSIYKSGQEVSRDITDEVEWSVAEGTAVAFTGSGKLAALSPGFAKIKASYSKNNNTKSLYKVIKVEDSAYQGRAAIVKNLENMADSHLWTLQSSYGISIDDGLYQGAWVDIDEENNRARLVTSWPEPDSASGVPDLASWKAYKLRAEATPVYILKNYSGFIHSMGGYSYMQEERKGFRSYVVQSIQASGYTQKVLHQLLVDPVKTYASGKWDELQLSSQAQQWKEEFSSYTQRIDNLNKNYDINQVINVSSDYDYYLQDKKPVISDAYLISKGPKELNQYIYSEVYTEKYAQGVDLENAIFEWAQSNSLTRGDLESLAGLIAQRRKKAEDLYDTLLDETELYELKEDINLFLGNKNYWGGDISSSGINDYNNTKYSRYKKLSDNEATEIERWKRAIGTAEFKRERLARLIAAYKTEELAAQSVGINLHYMALDESPLMSQLRTWLGEDYPQVKTNQQTVAGWRSGLEEILLKLLAAAKKENLISDSIKNDTVDFNRLLQIEILKAPEDNSDVAALITSCSNYMDGLETVLADTGNQAGDWLEAFREIESLITEYNYYPSRVELNQLGQELGYSELYLDKEEDFNDYCLRLEGYIQAPQTLEGDFLKCRKFLAKLQGSSNSGDIAAGSLSFLVDKEKGYWCISLREGKLTATASDQPLGDFNIRLAPGQGEIISNPGGGLKLLGDPPLEQYTEYPPTGYTNLALFGAISNQVYAVLLPDGSKVKLFLDELEMEDPEHMRTIIQWAP